MPELSSIAILHPSLSIRGGAENVVAWLAGDLARRGHRVTVFTSDFGERTFGAVTEQPYAVRIIDAGGYDLNRHSVRRWERAASLLAVELEGFQLINPHNFPSYIWAAWARRLNPRLAPIAWYCEDRGFHSHVVDSRSPEPAMRVMSAPRFWPAFCSHLKTLSWYERPRTAYRLLRQQQLYPRLKALDRDAVRSLDRILANSRFSSDWVQSLYGMDSRVCHLGIPSGRFSPETRAARTGKVTCSITRLFAPKNVATILDALALVKDHPGMRGLVHHIIGEGPQMAELRERANQLGLAGRVLFAGFHPGEVGDILRQSSAFVHIPLDEPFGLVYLEAALFGVPSIASAQGGPAEVVADQVTGFLVDPLDSRSVAAALLRVISEPGLSERLGGAALESARSYFSLESFVDRFLEGVRDLA